MAKLLWTQKEDIGPAPRLQHAMAYDAVRERVVLFGGHIGPPSLQDSAKDTWEWDGESWTQMNDIGPAARDCHAMAYDSVTRQVILFGGYHPQLKDTWGWDGEDWTQLADTGPEPRMATAMASDSKRGRVVLFGGIAPTPAFLRDTWEWDGVEWTQAEDVGPSLRAAHVMVYDPGRERVLLFGGLGLGPGGVSSYVNDTWEWDGRRWAQVQDIGPVRGLCAAARTLDAAVLFGGALISAGNFKTGLRDTWRWDGKHWSQRADIGPPPRVGHAMAYDEKRQRVVLFGGSDLGYPLLGDTWELFESSPA